jgi:hypothetical protein
MGGKRGFESRPGSMALKQCRVGKGKYDTKRQGLKANPGVPPRMFVQCKCCRLFYIKK